MNYKTYFVRLILLSIPALFLLSCGTETGVADRAEILAIMDNQEACWNEGDLECFMEGYWPSDSLMFVGSSGVVYGYDNTLDRYLKTYPDRSAMGMLSFDIVDLQQLSTSYFHMVGKWQLKREIGDLDGHFTLLFRKIDGTWYIVRDHSS